MTWIYDPAIAKALIAVIGILLGATATFAYNYCSERLKRRWKIIDIKRKYSSEIIRSADELAARISNLQNSLKRGVGTTWLRPISEEEVTNVPFRRYYFSSSVYLFGRLVSWIEILKREQIFLDFSSTKETRKFNSYLELMYSTISYSALIGDEHERRNKNHWIYYHYLGGVGEFFFTKDQPQTQLRSITFHEFSQKYKENSNSDFRAWVKEIENMFVGLSDSSDDMRWQRLQMLWLSLDRFLQFADPKKLRTTRDRKKSSSIGADLKEKILRQAKWHGLKLKI